MRKNHFGCTCQSRDIKGNKLFLIELLVRSELIQSNLHKYTNKELLHAKKQKKQAWSHPSTDGHTGQIVIHTHPQYRYCLSGF
jgi:hypothetical protein